MIFAVRVPIGQERKVALVMAQTAKLMNLQIYSILYTSKLKGRIFVEAPNVFEVRKLASKVMKIKRIQRGVVEVDEIVSLITRVPEIEVKPGDVVEILDGALRGAKAIVRSVDKQKSVAELSLVEISPAWTITISLDKIRVLEQAKEEAESSEVG
ncbi:MAG: transcription elongation factor Spt5 [Thermoproteota archaeon]|nr:MAG: transcription elongation factor Spt5 [Candidatus Korarchaeota archaeon]RLG55554.1 MAG: transcription elongation factor Spt5 [Candidatus Korarchaeota archaeon]